MYYTYKNSDWYIVVFSIREPGRNLNIIKQIIAWKCAVFFRNFILYGDNNHRVRGINDFMPDKSPSFVRFHVVGPCCIMV